MRGLVHDVGGKNERAVGIVRRILPIAWLLAALVFCQGAQAAPPRERPPRVAPEEIFLHAFDADGNELALRVPVNILLGQLQQPGNTASINLSQIAGTAVSSALYDGGNNALKVNCIVGCTGAASFTDNSAFTAGSTSVTNVSGLFNDSATNLTSGNAGAIRATTDRMLFVNIGKINGTVPTLTGSSLNVNCTGGCSSANASTNVTQFGGSNVVTGTGASGAGIPRVTISNDSSLAANQSVNLNQVGGTAVVTGGVAGSQGIGGTTAAGSAVAGNPVQLAGEASGNVTRVIICDKFAAVSINTATTTKIIPLVSGQTTYLCGWNFYSGGTNNVALVYGTGTNCGTGTLGITGGTTAATGYNFLAQSNVSVQLPAGSPVKETTAANDTCIITSAAVQLSGMISFTQF